MVASAPMETNTRLPFDPPKLPPTLECRNPATLEKLGDVPVFDRDAVVDKVKRARRAQARWGIASFAQRRQVLQKLLDYIVEHQDEICRICARDSGKTLVDAMMGQIFPVCEKLRYTISNGERDLLPERRGSGVLMHKTVLLEYAPLGVIGVL